MRALVPATLIITCLACARSNQPTAEKTPDATPTTAESVSPSPIVGWQRIDAPGPEARRDYTFTGDPTRELAYLFGGRSKSGALSDLWVFDVAAGSWGAIEGKGPPARFGHSAQIIGDRHLVFGGQVRSNEFLNDLWELDLKTMKWRQLEPGEGPSPRYGSGSTVFDDELLVTHGFTNRGRFDDTWAYENGWTEVSPTSAPRPIKRCLLKLSYLSSTKQVILFGGQTNDDPFLSDTWTYNPTDKVWSELDIQGPSDRNQYAAMASDEQVWIFGGTTEQGDVNDLWAFDGDSWSVQNPAGEKPSARSGIDAAVVGSRALIFGGKGPDKDLSDLWMLTLT